MRIETANLPFEIVVYGDLLTRAAPSARPDRMREFLYGPEDAPAPLFRSPQGLAVGMNGVYVCDQGYPDILRVAPDGSVNRWTSREDRPACPVAVACAPDGTVFVVDATQRAVLHYGPDGGLQKSITASEDRAEAWRPCSVLVDGGMLLIGDCGGGTVHAVDPLSGVWSTPAFLEEEAVRLLAPTGLASAAHLGTGAVHVADALTGSVHTLGAGDASRPVLGSSGRATGSFVRPMHVACTPGGVTAVTDAGKQTLQVFLAAGAPPVEFGASIPGWRGFTLPTGVVDATRLAHDPAWSAILPALEPGEELLLVSDALGPVSITLIGVRRHDTAPRKAGEP